MTNIGINIFMQKFDKIYKIVINTHFIYKIQALVGPPVTDYYNHHGTEENDQKMLKLRYLL